MTRLIQYRADDGSRGVALVESGDVAVTLEQVSSTFELAHDAFDSGRSLEETVLARAQGARLDYQELVDQKRLLPSLDHMDPAHCLVTGTGLTHLGSAATRDSMHVGADEEETLTDSMKMFRLGLEGGKPEAGTFGVQPEWFYKGDGSIVASPERPLISPGFALDAGEEPELAGLYVIAPDGTPLRVGFALANEFSDHVTEKQNYLYLAHSKLRMCAIGPELLVGTPPDDIQGTSRIRRGDAVIWERPFVTGEANMSHTIANLEAHHFKYPLFRRPGDAHVHMFGTATLSFADGVKPEAGDVFEIEAADFGRPLRNPLNVADAEAFVAVSVL